jgi:hypothetical protein
MSNMYKLVPYEELEEGQMILGFGIHAVNLKHYHINMDYGIVPVDDPNEEIISTVRTAVESLKESGYRCEAGPLEKNVAFIALEKIGDDAAGWNSLKNYPAYAETVLVSRRGIVSIGFMDEEQLSFEEGSGVINFWQVFNMETEQFEAIEGEPDGWKSFPKPIARR